MTAKVMKNVARLFELYCLAGGNVTQAHRAAKREKINITLKTLRAWAKEFNFKERLLAVDQAAIARARGLKEMAQELLHQRIEKYEARFQESKGEKLNHMATFAYIALVRQAGAFMGADPAKTAPEFESMSAEEKQQFMNDIMKEVYGVDQEPGAASGSGPAGCETPACSAGDPPEESQEPGPDLQGEEKREELKRRESERHEKDTRDYPSLNRFPNRNKGF